MPINADNFARNLNRAAAETTFFAFLLWYLDPAQRDVSNVGYVARMMLIAFLTLVFRGFYNEMAKEGPKPSLETKQVLPTPIIESMTTAHPKPNDPLKPSTPLVSHTRRARFNHLTKRKLTASSSDESNTEEVQPRTESPTNRV